MTQRFDVVCVGAGILGLATAMTLAKRYRVRIAVIEAERETGLHQTGRNSGVIHSGLYYKPGSLKANNCYQGRRRLLALCDEHQIEYDLCGKLVIATDASELPRLDELEQRGRANGLEGLLRIEGAEIPRYEPHATGIEALWVPATGIINYSKVLDLYAQLFAEHGGDLRLGARLVSVKTQQDRLQLETTEGPIEAKYLINCAGLQSDRVARMAGAEPHVRIVPFRGDYFDLKENKRHLLRALIYPVPDPRFPFLGVHLTRRLDGSIEAGPNAVLALRREGYTAPRFNARDAASALFYPGLWRLGARFWKIGLSEYLRSGNEKRFAAALQKFVPAITAEDLTPGGCGIRAQALSAKGDLLDDFAIEQSTNALHVLNAPSPGATASLAIADQLTECASKHFGLAPLSPQ